MRKMSNVTRRLLAATAVAGLAALTGCGSGGHGKVGTLVEPVTLTMADANGGTATDGVLAYIREVNKLSHGAVRIKLVSASEDGAGFETKIIKQTASGHFDMAWVGGRALEAAGISEAAALQVPFQITNYATEAKVIGGPVGATLTKEMSRAGVVGIGLLDDRLRYMVTTKPIAAPSDLAGKRMRTFGSPSQAEAWRAFGASPAAYGGNTALAVADMRRGSLFGVESDSGSWADHALTGTV